ncbi:HalOD1 output domain-containing protein [Halobellus salinisoli]|uniref:HalOD1 output domain-containing protein n=1 Tax=Halobellus salinisoli TaxID=3108500 RepID=UPI00300B3A06
MTKHTDSGAESTDDTNATPTMRWRQITQRHYDSERDGELTTAIVYAIAEAMDVEPKAVESPTLYETIDVAAIERTLFNPGTTTGSEEGSGSVEFRYDEYRVTVRSDGWVRVDETTEAGL